MMSKKILSLQGQFWTKFNLY